MKHVILIRSAYGPGWTLEANQRRLAMTEGVTIASLRSQTSQAFDVIVLLHADDPLALERWMAFEAIGARFLYTHDLGSPATVAYNAYKAPWAEDIDRSELVAMTRLDDDDGFAPWAMASVQAAAERISIRTVLMFPIGVRAWEGRYTLVRHSSNAMHTLVTPPGDTATVYDYGHRYARRFAPVELIDRRPAWLWSRHNDTISGWRAAERPLTAEIRALFRVDWSLFGEPQRQKRAAAAGRVFR